MIKAGKKNGPDREGAEWLAETIDALKHLPRTGWHKRGLRGVESVAAHTTGASLWLLWLIERYEARYPKRIDRGKALAMVLIHDLPEASLGDITPAQKALLFGADPRGQSDGITAAEGRFWQTAPLAPVIALPPPSPSFDGAAPGSLSALWSNFFSLWEEYRSGLSIEAALVKQADALDCVFQAIVYRSQGATTLEEFAPLIQAAAKDDQELRQMLADLWADSQARQMPT